MLELILPNYVNEEIAHYLGLTNSARTGRPGHLAQYSQSKASAKLADENSFSFPSKSARADDENSVHIN